METSGGEALGREEAIVEPARKGPPGPGLPEALSWTVGVFAIQIVASGIVAVALLVIQAAMGGTEALSATPAGFSDEMGIAMFSGTQLLFVLAAIAAVFLRLGPRAMKRLAVTGIPSFHLALIPFLLLSASLVSVQLYAWCLRGWEWLTSVWPGLEVFDAFNAMEMVEEFSKQAPLWVLIATIALAPAIGEELFFRGIVGRGLVARWGLPAGILMTSVLFAVVHLHPVHALALLPLAVAFHLSYVASRSILAPMLLHGLNNLLAVVMSKMPQGGNIPGGDDTSGISLPLFAVSVVCLICVGIVMWKTRVQYLLPGDTVWSPGYPTVEVPPEGMGAVRRTMRAKAWLMAAAACTLLAFAAILAYDVWKDLGA